MQRLKNEISKDALVWKHESWCLKEAKNKAVWRTMTAADAAEPRASGRAAAVTLRSTVTRVHTLLKQRYCSVVESPVIGPPENDHEKTKKHILQLQRTQLLKKNKRTNKKK